VAHSHDAHWQFDVPQQAVHWQAAVAVVVAFVDMVCSGSGWWSCTRTR
jgi:cytochrome b561